MNEPIADRKRVWDRFLERWPLEVLPTITLEEYSTAKDDDCFTYWLEAQTESLGSIWGGSAFKFGIFARGNSDEAEDGGGRSYSDKYGWYTKYGDNPENAFERVISEVSRVAVSAREGNLQNIDEANLGDAFKWKVAFLYQNREVPCVLPIYKADWLRIAANSQEKKISVLQGVLLTDLGTRNILEYGDEVWSSIQAKLATELTPDEAKSILDASLSFRPIKTPTKKMAGYEAENGQQVVLELTNNTTTLYLSPGPWLEKLDGELGKVRKYAKEKSRNSNLSSNAPRLAVGNEIVSVVIPTESVMHALCEAYSGSTHSEPSASPSNSGIKAMPLNQIFYGPPGTGKTFNTVNKSLEILDSGYLEAHKGNRGLVRKKFDELCAEGRIALVTFHQSFSYEDFVEGLKATSEDGQINYEVEDGVFKRMCLLDQASVEIATTESVSVIGKTIWKMSLGDTLGDDAYIYDHCLENNEIRLGYGREIDFSEANSRQAVIERFEEEGVELRDQDYRVTAVNIFRNQMQIGDLVVVSDGNTKFRAIGEIAGEYQCIPNDALGHYAQTRTIKWHRVWDRSLPFEALINKKFSQMTLYQLKPKVVKLEKLSELFEGRSQVAKTRSLYPGLVFAAGSYEIVSVGEDLVRVRVNKTGSTVGFDMEILKELSQRVERDELTTEDIKAKKVFEKTDSSLEKYIVNGYPGVIANLVDLLTSTDDLSLSQSQETGMNSPRVLIIDEINRGNIASIFGELITLIEPSKRAGNDEASEVVLPYSKEKFSVPNNLYIIGTMNTADRSLALLDTALRRRFEFEAMMPDSSLLSGVVVEGVEIEKLLNTLNQRIELLYDRDHLLGHSFFMELDEDSNIRDLRRVFERNILPTLEEYFFEDWSRIRQILGDDLKQLLPQILVPRFTSSEIDSLLGPDLAGEVGSSFYMWNESALNDPQAYIGIYSPA